MLYTRSDVLESDCYRDCSLLCEAKWTIMRHMILQRPRMSHQLSPPRARRPHDAMATVNALFTAHEELLPVWSLAAGNVADAAAWLGSVAYLC